MKIYSYSDLTEDKINKLFTRGNLISDGVTSSVAEIGKQIKSRGDEALKEFTQMFDKAELEYFKVRSDELNKAEELACYELKQAIKTAKENIWKFHSQQIKAEEKIETSKGVYCWREFRAIENVGIYIPGGSAPLFSTVLMLAIPALIAGCKKIVVCTPPNSDGEISPEILWTAKFLGIDEIYKAGGAQAIFAMAYGTKQIPKVDKIFGPGNPYVTAAKMQASSLVAIDMPAGPSEVLVIADESSNPAYVASDLLSQAEHGADSQVVLLCNNEDMIKKILAEVDNQIKALPRAEIAVKSLENSFVIIVPDMETALDLSNLYAPEHLILSMTNFNKYLLKIKNAGSVFCGIYSSESFGDYASGTNHTLPTSGFAKSYSGVSVLSFGKWITFQEVTGEGLHELGKTVELMAEKEQLIAHKNAVSVRLKQ